MKKIMIVEDDEVIKDELSELLKNSSYLVESIKNFEKSKIPFLSNTLINALLIM